MHRRRKNNAGYIELLYRKNAADSNKTLLEEKKLLAFKLNTPVFQTYLAFFHDILPAIDKANTNLQGNKRTIDEAEEFIKTIKARIFWWRTDVRCEVFDDLPSFNKYLSNQSAETRERILGVVGKDILKNLNPVQKLLKGKFETLHEVQYWMIDQLNVVDTQLPCDPRLRAAIREMRLNEAIEFYFKEAENALDFWANARLLYPEISSAAIKVLLPFVTTYRCEAAFSRLKRILSERRTRAHVEAVLICGCMDYEPDWDEVIKHKLIFMRMGVMQIAAIRIAIIRTRKQEAQLLHKF